MKAQQTRNNHPGPGITSPPADKPESGGSSERLAYSVDEAAQLTGLSRDLLYDEMRRGNLDYLKVGRRRLITRQHLEQFLDIAPRPQPSPATARPVTSRQLRMPADTRRRAGHRGTWPCTSG